MRIDATALAVEGLRYASPARAGGENEVVLGASGGVTGFYESAPSGHTVEATADRFEIGRASWRVGEGTIGVGPATRLQHVALDLRIPSGDGKTTVRLAGEVFELRGLRHATDAWQLDAHVLLEGAIVERDASGKLTVVAVAAALTEVSFKMGSVELRVDLVKARKVAIVSDGDALRLAADGIELERISVVAGDTTARADRLDVPRGVSWQDGNLELAELGLRGLVVSSDLPGRPAQDAAPPPPASAKRLPDVAALDQLDGHLEADVRIHATLPVVKERGATHALRVPIDRGAISFGELEDGFSAVADALLDFEVEGDELRLELDVIPIVKFDNVTLLSWKLVDPVDRELAAQKAIRLRRLLQFERPSSKEEKPAKRHDKGAIRLLGLDVAPIALHLSARAPVTIPIGGGVVRLDDGEGRAVASFELGGAVHIALEGESSPGELRASLAGVVAMIDGVAVGPATIASARLDLPRIDSIHASLDGATPTRISAVVPTLRVRGLSARIGARP